MVIKGFFSVQSYLQLMWKCSLVFKDLPGVTRRMPSMITTEEAHSRQLTAVTHLQKPELLARGGWGEKEVTVLTTEGCRLKNTCKATCKGVSINIHLPGTRASALQSHKNDVPAFYASPSHFFSLKYLTVVILYICNMHVYIEEYIFTYVYTHIHCLYYSIRFN